ncbi:hypothetical protein [Streptomyces naphthomycinicus]|uniref:hypothetical protein n=1 Tax=Streptomyces naphthomycinicus TaxID=2872625 RepID=UPI001CEDF7C7|nr:hypothetical protein [Streptomyces sp. TML10]
MTGPGCYHLLVAAGGRPVLHGWWGREETAREKFRRWIGEYGSVPGAWCPARVTLIDETTGETLASWPDPQ